MYIDFDDYSKVYKDLTEADFAYLGLKACFELDRQTKGIDGYSKLDNAFPLDEKSAMAVKICAIELVHFMALVEKATNANGYDVDAEGKYVGKQIKSVSSGSESITYSAGTSAFDNVVTSPEEKKHYIASMVREYLSGITDANGVNLLYMGAYPNV